MFIKDNSIANVRDIFYDYFDTMDDQFKTAYKTQ